MMRFMMRNAIIVFECEVCFVLFVKILSISDLDKMMFKAINRNLLSVRAFGSSSIGRSRDPPTATSSNSQKTNPALLALIAKYNLEIGSINPDQMGEYLRRCGLTLSANDTILATPLETTFKSIPVSTIRGIVASRLTLSKSTIPHEYGAIDCSMNAVIGLRKELNSAKDATVKISVNDFVVSAVAKALKIVPPMNATFERNKHQIRKDVDVAVAVSIPDGLITPVIRKADLLSLPEISTQIKDLAAKAKERRLKPQQFQGSSFTVSNLGMFGIRSFSAVINPPEVGILAIGASRHQAKSTLDRPDNLMRVTLSYDARAITPEVTAAFLEHVKDHLENPRKLLS